MSRRDKIAEAIRQEVSIILHDKLKDPRLGFITITGAEVSADLRHAKILFSVLGGDEDYKKTKEALDSAQGFIRKLVSEKINLKFAPEIIFREDRSSEYSCRIEEVLNEIKELSQPHPAKDTVVRVGKGKEGRGGPKKSSGKRKKA